MKDFVFDKENHIGYFKGKVVPSITQLVGILFPMGNIKDEVLNKASERGTKVHEDIDNFNLGLVSACGTKEGKNWVLLMKSLGFVSVASEFEVLYKDDEGNVIAYGHADQLLQAKSYVYLDNTGKLRVEDEPTFEGGETILYAKGDIILNDNKTVSQFDNNKVELQLNLYAIGEIENAVDDFYLKKTSKLIGTWVRDDKAQIRPLNLWEKAKATDTLKGLIEVWKESNNGND